MRLYVVHNHTRVYLNSQAPTRYHLLREIGSQRFSLNGITYDIRQVVAEPSTGSTVAGAAIGGLVGLIAGPIGVLSGVTIGGIIGNKSEESEKLKVQNFNRSSLNY